MLRTFGRHVWFFYQLISSVLSFFILGFLAWDGLTGKPALHYYNFSWFLILLVLPNIILVFLKRVKELQHEN